MNMIFLMWWVELDQNAARLVVWKFQGTSLTIKYGTVDHHQLHHNQKATRAYNNDLLVTSGL